LLTLPFMVEAHRMSPPTLMRIDAEPPPAPTPSVCFAPLRLPA